MTVVFAGTETEAFIAANGAPVETTASGGTRYDSAAVRCSMQLGGSLKDELDTPPLGSLATAWTHFEIYSSDMAGYLNRTYCEWFNNAATSVFRLRITTVNKVQMQYWNGSAWTAIGAEVNLGSGTRKAIDVKIVCGGSGSAALYIDSALVASGSASMTSVTDIDRFKMKDDQAGSSILYWSQVIIATTSTVGWKFYSKPPTGNGANTAFTGAFGDVDEAVRSDSDFISSTAANDVETYTGAAITLASGSVKAVVVTMRVKNDGSAPNNVQGALRRGSTNYFSSNLSINSGFGPAVAIWEQDPSTSAAWTGADASSASTEFGAKSIT